MQKQITRGEVAPLSTRKKKKIVPPTPPQRQNEPQRDVVDKPSRTADDPETGSSIRLTLQPPFDVSRAGEACHEVRDGDGVVVAWTPDRATALVLAGLLEAATGG